MGFNGLKVMPDNCSVTVAEQSIYLKPTPSIHLKTIDDVRLEMSKIYRDMKYKRIETSDGTKLVYVLSQIGKMIELHDIERRLIVLENRRVK